MPSVKFMVMGHKQHGKDTVGDMIAEYLNLRSISSSMFACEAAVFPTLSKEYGYPTILECYEDRDNHRPEWHELIWRYNEHDPAKLARELYKNYDIYVGIRHDVEFAAIKSEGLFHYSIWVDASKRKPPESTDSCKVTMADAQYVITNNGTEEELEANVQAFLSELLG